MRTLECWQVEFNCYSTSPHVAVPEGTSLDMIEQAAREVMEEKFPGDEYGLENMFVKSVTRLQSIHTLV